MNRLQLLLPQWKNKIVTLSYDDGNISDRRLVKVLNKFGLKSTFHLSSEKLDTKGSNGEYISKNEVKTLYREHEVACHTKNHTTLTLMPKEQIIQEILENRQTLEGLVGYPVRGFSYPMGVFDNRVKEVLLACGIEYARTTRTTGRFDFPLDYFEWHSTCHHNDNLLSKTTEFLLRERPNTLSMLYVWGHSYEFEQNKNWDVIEQFGEKIAKSPDIWCATNIQILDYLTAFQKLCFSVDGTFVYNPTATDVYLIDYHENRNILAEHGKITYITSK